MEEQEGEDNIRKLGGGVWHGPDSPSEALCSRGHCKLTRCVQIKSPGVAPFLAILKSF